VDRIRLRPRRRSWDRPRLPERQFLHSGCCLVQWRPRRKRQARLAAVPAETWLSTQIRTPISASSPAPSAVPRACASTSRPNSNDRPCTAGAPTVSCPLPSMTRRVDPQFGQGARSWTCLPQFAHSTAGTIGRYPDRILPIRRKPLSSAVHWRTTSARANGKTRRGRTKPTLRTPFRMPLSENAADA
jgi:hypothetical protein